VALPSVLSKIIQWLHAGYPEGVPATDYVPLVALLGSHLSERDVSLIADELALTGDANSARAMRTAIEAVTSEPPLDVDIARVRARLAAGGWPLAEPGGLA
jgi:hypothetical protein